MPMMREGLRRIRMHDREVQWGPATVMDPEFTGPLTIRLKIGHDLRVARIDYERFGSSMFLWLPEAEIAFLEMAGVAFTLVPA